MPGILIKFCCHSGKADKVDVNINRSSRYFMLNYLQRQGK